MLTPQVMVNHSPLRFGRDKVIDKDDPALAVLKKTHEAVKAKQDKRVGMGKSPILKGIFKSITTVPLAWVFAVGGAIGGLSSWSFRDYVIQDHHVFTTQADERAAQRELTGRVESVLGRAEALRKEGDKINYQTLAQANEAFYTLMGRFSEIARYSFDPQDQVFRNSGRYYSDSDRDYTYDASNQLLDFLRQPILFRGGAADLEKIIAQDPLTKTLSADDQKTLAQNLVTSLKDNPKAARNPVIEFFTSRVQPKPMNDLINHIAEKKANGLPLALEDFLKGHDFFKTLTPLEREKLSFRLYDATKERDSRERITSALADIFGAEAGDRLYAQIPSLITKKNATDIRAFMDTSTPFSKLTTEEKDLMAKAVSENSTSDRYQMNRVISPFFQRLSSGITHQDLMNVKTTQDVKNLISKSLMNDARFRDYSNESKELIAKRAHYWIDCLAQPLENKDGQFYHSSYHYYDSEVKGPATGFPWFLIVFSSLVTLGASLVVADSLFSAVSEKLKQKKALREKGFFKIQEDHSAQTEITRIQTKLTQHCNNLASTRTQLKSAKHPEVQVFFKELYQVEMNAEGLQTAYENRAQDEFVAAGRTSVSAGEFWREVEKQLDKAIKAHDYFPEIPTQQIVVSNNQIDFLPESQSDFVNRIQSDIDITNQSMARTVVSYMNQLIHLQEEETKREKLNQEEATLKKELENDKELSKQRALELKTHELELAAARIDTLNQTLVETKGVIEKLEAQRFEYQKRMMDVNNRENYDALLDKMRSVKRAQEELNTSAKQSPLLQQLKTLDLLQEAKSDVIKGDDAKKARQKEGQ